MTSKPVAIALGSNLGDREAHLAFAVARLSRILNNLRRSRWYDTEPVGVSPAPPDFCKIAEAYGVSAERLTATSALPDALRRASAAKSPYLIEITVD